MNFVAIKVDQMLLNMHDFFDRLDISNNSRQKIIDVKSKKTKATRKKKRRKICF